MNVQIIEKNGTPEWAVIPYQAYLDLIEDAEMLADIRDYDAAMEAIAAGEPLTPGEVLFAILDGKSPIRAWREYRGMSQKALAEAAGITSGYLSQLESGVRTGSAEVLSVIAERLNISLDDLIQR
jgi:DNA-binding XRE family transcriptional regulator